MNYYLILEESYEHYDGQRDYNKIYNFLLETKEELKLSNSTYKDVIYSEKEITEYDYIYFEHKFTKISSLVFEELKKDFTVRKEL